MKIITSILLAFVIVNTNSQPRPYINSIVKLIGSSVNAYFLAANRPTYGVDSYITPKGYMTTGAGVYFNKDIYDISTDISYGVSERVELSAGITAYSQTFNFLGEKIGGVGDLNIGLKYLIHESDYFDHTFQAIIKIPTASKTTELGTGKVDFYFGLAQGFYYRKFSIDAGLECNFLRRRDFPQSTRNIPPILKAQIDSLKSLYNYKYETELGFSISPSFSFSDAFGLYTGYSFTRNTRLNFNTNSVLYGVSISPGDVVNISLGGSYGLDDSSGWIAGLGLSFLFPLRK